MDKFIMLSFSVSLFFSIALGSNAADENGNVIVNNGGGVTIATDSSKVNTGIDLGEGGDKNVIKGNGDIKTEKRSLKDFKVIKISGAFDVVCKKDGSSEIKITGDGNLLPHIVSKISGEELLISTDSPISCKQMIKIELSIKDGIKEMELEGACKLDVKDLTSDKLEFSLGGTSVAVFSGKANKFEVEIEGACSLDAKEFNSKESSVTVAGASNADVFASEKLTVSISSLGTVNYYGNPKDVEKDISALGRLNKK